MTDLVVWNRTTQHRAFHLPRVGAARQVIVDIAAGATESISFVGPVDDLLAQNPAAGLVSNEDAGSFPRLPLVYSAVDVARPAVIVTETPVPAVVEAPVTAPAAVAEAPKPKAVAPAPAAKESPDKPTEPQGK